ATLLRLTLTTLLLQALFAVALFALIVVFQPELRRALGQLGQLGPLNRMLIPGGEEEIEGTVDELVRAALLISEAKHGALIVLERGTGLQDYSETGVPVNGKLTAELLASIFMTRSPLHDGAVIVRGGQILAAACLLPLEENTDRGAHRYGMRHRAALSISAQTDAIVVVVSEETQAISIAAGGRVAVERPDSVPAGYVVQGQLGDVSVRLKGTEAALANVVASDLHATLDLPAADIHNSDPQDVPVRVDVVTAGVKVESKAPATVTVRIE